MLRLKDYADQVRPDPSFFCSLLRADGCGIEESYDRANRAYHKKKEATPGHASAQHCTRHRLLSPA